MRQKTIAAGLCRPIPGLLFLLVCLSCAKDDTIAISIRYRGAAAIDIATFAYESVFIDGFRDRKFTSAKDESSKRTSVVLDAECQSIDRLVFNEKTYDLFSAQAQCKVSIIDGDGRTVYARDTGIVKGRGGTAAKAEIDALEELKKRVAEIVAEDRARMAEAL